MRRMQWIRFERCLVFELHDAGEGVAFSARRNIGTNMSLEKARDFPLKSFYLSGRSLLLGFRNPGLPLEAENMKDDCCLFFSYRVLIGCKKQAGRS